MWSLHTIFKIIFLFFKYSWHTPWYSLQVYTIVIRHLNSQDMEAAKVPISRCVGTEGVIHIRNGILALQRAKCRHLQEPGWVEQGGSVLIRQRNTNIVLISQCFLNFLANQSLGLSYCFFGVLGFPPIIWVNNFIDTRVVISTTYCIKRV